MRRRWRWSRERGELVEIAIQRPTNEAPTVWDDLPGYQSPVSGLWIEGRRARRDDLARNQCRPWEGMEQEKREAAKVQGERERASDQLAEKMAHRAWAEAPERIRRIFRGK